MTKTTENNDRCYWDMGEEPPFRLVKDACQKFIQALVVCDGQIHCTHSMDIANGQPGNGMKLHQVAALFRISIPRGLKSKFEEIMGVPDCLTDPPVVTGS